MIGSENPLTVFVHLNAFGNGFSAFSEFSNDVLRMFESQANDSRGSRGHLVTQTRRPHANNYHMHRAAYLDHGELVWLAVHARPAEGHLWVSQNRSYQHWSSYCPPTFPLPRLPDFPISSTTPSHRPLSLKSSTA